MPCVVVTGVTNTDHARVLTEIFGWDTATGELVCRYPHTFRATPSAVPSSDWDLSTGPKTLFAARATELFAFEVG